MKGGYLIHVPSKIRPDFIYKTAKFRVATFTIKKIVNISRDPK